MYDCSTAESETVTGNIRYEHILAYRRVLAREPEDFHTIGQATYSWVEAYSGGDGYLDCLQIDILFCSVHSKNILSYHLLDSISQSRLIAINRVPIALIIKALTTPV